MAFIDLGYGRGRVNNSFDMLALYWASRSTWKMASIGVVTFSDDIQSESIQVCHNEKTIKSCESKQIQ